MVKLSCIAGAYFHKTPTQLWLRTDALDFSKNVLNLKTTPGTYQHFIEIASYYREEVGAGETYQSYALWAENALQQKPKVKQALMRRYFSDVIYGAICDLQSALQSYKHSPVDITNYGFLKIDSTIMPKIVDLWFDENSEEKWYHGEYFILEHKYDDDIKAIKTRRGKRSK